LEFSGRIRCSRTGIVDENHPMSYEDIIFDGYPLTDEGVAGYLAVFTDDGALLDFDKGAYFCVVSYLAAVKIDEPGEFDIFTQTYAIHTNIIHR
jgi:hypothetical protein